MSNLKKKEIFILLLCFIIGFALRFYTFDQKSLWIDEVYTLNDSRDNLKDQLKFYKENATFLHPPLFFILTHLFYPFPKPERDLRIIPLIFGTLSIPMFYLLAKLFSSTIALPCTLSITFMTYHIYFSQEARSYSMLMLLGMGALYFFMKYLKTLKKVYLPFAALLFAILFHTNYSSFPFIVLSQILFLYQTNENDKKTNLTSFFILNGTIFLLCIPWILFLALNYKGQPLMPPFQGKAILSFWKIIYWILSDWFVHLPLIISSIALLILAIIFSKYRNNAIILLILLPSSIGAVYLFCKLFNISHFITSKYFINFLPPFLISLYLSLNAMEAKFEGLKISVRLSLLFLIFFIASNLTILPFYYRSEKQDLRGLVTFLKGHLKEGDKIFDTMEAMGNMPGILHYFGIYPEGRHYIMAFRKVSENEFEYAKPFTYQNQQFVIYNSNSCCKQYIQDGGRVWMITNKKIAKKVKENTSFNLMGYFDGSFFSGDRFPEDASMYLFLWDPSSPNEKGIDMPIE
jgi:hypothetical protein